MPSEKAPPVLDPQARPGLQEASAEAKWAKGLVKKPPLAGENWEASEALGLEDLSEAGGQTFSCSKTFSVDTDSVYP